MIKVLYGERNAALFFNISHEVIRWLQNKGTIRPEHIKIGGVWFKAYGPAEQKAIREHLKKKRAAS